MLDERFRVMGRTKWYETIEAMQKDLDNYLKHYNNKRPHQGRTMKSRTPNEVFIKELPKPENEEGSSGKKAA